MFVRPRDRERDVEGRRAGVEGCHGDFGATPPTQRRL